MTGFQAITAQNGWAMALLGASIVMVGLSLLALFISQLHKLIALFERQPATQPPPAAQPSPSALIDRSLGGPQLLDDPATASSLYRTLSSELGSRFNLSQFYQLLTREGLPHPHLTIRMLRDAGYLIPAGDSLFCWKSE